ncbi:MAG: IS630 family transposase [bacterium]|nr:IS630 family transposase [bacterium]
MEAARAQTPGRAVEVWAFDEHRLGLKPLTRRVWAKIGARPLAVSRHRYQWLYLYAFVRPANGAVEWWVANAVNSALFQSVIDAFAAAAGAGPDKAVVLLLDNAGWHRAKKLKIPEGLRLCFLPPYSPELQPAERLWPITDEAIANRCFETLDELAETLDQRCSALTDQPEVIKANTLFHWWPAE